MKIMKIYAKLSHSNHKHLIRREVLSVLLIVVILVCLLSTIVPLGMNIPNAYADEDVFYDFIAEASKASWGSGAGSLPFPGTDNDNRGFALYRNNAQLEDNSTKALVLETHPQWVSNGWIMGKYPQLTIPTGVELEVTLGFLYGATGTDGVIFEVQFEEGQNRQTILSHLATYDGKLNSVTKSLSSLAGKNGQFILYVNAGQSSGRDWAIWAEAKITTIAPPALPDLATTEVWHSDGQICYSIKNVGNASTGSAGAPTSFYNILLINGQQVAEDHITAPLSPGDQFDRCFDYQWKETPGRHAIKVCADQRQDIIESNEQNNCSEQVWKIEEQLPDLIVESIKSGPGNKLSVTIKNTGSGYLPSGWAAIAEAYFDGAKKGDFDLKNPSSIKDGGIANPGGSSNYLLAWDIAAPVKVRVIADSTKNIAESNEQNNVREEKIEPLVTELPDLIIEEIKCDQESKQVGYVIINNGQAAAAPSHVTVLLVNSKGVCKDTIDSELAPGQRQTSWFGCYEWPQNQSIEIKVCADYYEQVNESNEQNNCVSGECVPAVTPLPMPCPTECECLPKEEGYARGLEFRLDENGTPILCEVINAEQGLYKYCFKTRKEAPPLLKPVYPKRDVNGDDLVDYDDVAIIAAHYGGKTGKSRVPWDINNDGSVDYKDLAIVGARFGKSIIDEKLEGEGITNPRQFLERVGSASTFQELSLRTDISTEGLLQATMRADMKSVIPSLEEPGIRLLEGLNIGYLAGLQSLPVEDQRLMNMLYDELRLEWIASGGKERGELLPTLEDLTRWVTDAKRVTPTVQVSEEAITFPDGSSLNLEEDDDLGDRETQGNQFEVMASGISTSVGSAPEVFGKSYPGMGTSTAVEGIRPHIPPPSVPEPCPHIEGYIINFPYDINTLKIKAERIELRMQFNPLTREPLGFRPTVLEGKMVDVQQANIGPHGSPVTFYSTGCLTLGNWKLTPVFYAEETEVVVWRGSWSPAFQEISISSGLDSPSDINFTFIPIETVRPTITITHAPEEPFGGDVVTFSVSIRDDNMLQKVEIYEWGRYPDGTQTEPELVASYFWDHGFPRERFYRFERGPYSSGGPNEIHFEVAAWDYAGNPQSRSDVLSVTHFTVPSFITGVIGVPIAGYYVTSIGEIVFSKDSDNIPPEGEMHCSSHATLIKHDGSTTEMVQDYPYFKWVEAYRREGAPVCWPWMPALAVRQSELGNYDGYTLNTSVYENDSAFERFLRGLLHVLTGFVSLAIDAVTCVVEIITGAEGASCTSLMCEVLGLANIAGSNIGDVEDDYMGTATFMTTKEANFGLQSGITWADYFASGSADEWRNDWNGVTTEGSIVEGACSQVATGTTISGLQQGVSWLLGGGGENWIKVLNHVHIYETRPIDEVKVKFVGARVISDRDGSLRGAGDIFARTLIGTIGGTPADSNAHSLVGDDLSKLPYSAADTYKFDCGDVDSGHSFTKNKFIFEHDFADPNLALLYVQIALWDDDGALSADNEVGVLSILWPAATIMDMIEHPDEATRHGEAITVTVVHPVETYEGEVVYAEGMPTDPTQDYYYIITDTREVWTRCEYREGESGFWGYPGAQITYEMWIKPYR